MIVNKKKLPWKNVNYSFDKIILNKKIRKSIFKNNSKT